MPSEHRLHPTSILFALAGSVKAFWLPALVLLVTSGRSSPDSTSSSGWARWMNPWSWVPFNFDFSNWQFWLMLLVIPSGVVAIARYLSFRMRYEGTELVIRSGIVFRNERHVPYARIQNLDAERNVAHRLLHVAKVRVETGGGQEPEATISVLHETVFEEMRRHIFEGRARVTAPDVVDTESDAVAPVLEPRPLLYLGVRELLLNGVLDNRGMILVAAASGVLWEAGLFNRVWDRIASVFGFELVQNAARAFTTGALPSIGRITVFLGGMVALLVLVRVLSMIWSVLRLYEFRLSRVGEDLRTEYGLLTRVTATIPLRRVQTVMVREAPLQRLVKRMSVRVDTAGGQGKPEQGQKQPREWLAPIIRRSAVPDLLREVLPGFELGSLDWQPLHPRAFRRAVKPAVLLAFVFTLPLVAWLGGRGLLPLPFIVAVMAVATWKHVQHTKWAATEDVVAFRSGWLWRHVTVVPVVKVQTVACSESPFDRRHAMASLQVDTAAPRSQSTSVSYLARDTAKGLYERLSLQAAQTTFRW